jgi:nucleotide-binding universal stress UspA family protein
MTILVAVDRIDESERILAEGATLAGRFETAIEVVHVMSRSEFVDLERTTVSDTSKAVDIDEVRAAATDTAREVAEPHIDEFSATGSVGDPASEVLRIAAEHDARYVVIGVRNRSRVGKAVFGSTAQKILLNSDRPIVAVPRAGGAE